MKYTPFLSTAIINCEPSLYPVVEQVVADPLRERLRSRIKAEGAISFRDWMELALYDEQDGYYMRPGQKTGVDGDSDFATSPVLHPFMAQSVGREIVDLWERQGRSKNFVVVEFGGGEGHLAGDALAWLDQQAPPKLARHLKWIHIERSPVHRQRQQEQADDERLLWSEEMPNGTVGLVVAHEFVDALPFHILEYRKGNWAEVFVGLNGKGQMAETYNIPSAKAIDAAPLGVFREGQRLAAMADAQAWIEDVARRLDQGAILIVDYGDREARLWSRDPGGATVRAFQGHEVQDVDLDAPGTQDVTASVDFASLAVWALGVRMREAVFETQEAFLIRHGVLDALNATERDSLGGASAYLRLRQMVLPTGMGEAFRVQRLEKGL